MKKCYILFLFFLFLLSFQDVNGQSTVSQTFIDKCSGEVKVATTTYVNGQAVISFYNQIRTFTPMEVNSGIAQAWLISVKSSYEAITCPLSNPVVTQTVQQTVTQTATAAATAAASSAASAAASTASSAASSSASSAASGSASSAAANSSPPSGNTSSSSSTSGGSSSSESGSSSSGGGSSESKSESNTESKSESKSEESTSESKEESKSEESTSESKEEKTEEKKEEKKKQQNMNPMLLSSDLTSAQSIDGRYSVMLSMGVSRTSMAGDKSFGVNGIVWSTLDQYVISSSYTKMDFSNGKLNAIHSYGTSIAYLKGVWMNLTSYTFIKPNPKIGTYGVNVGAISLLTKGVNGKHDINMSTSLVGFWTKPFQYSTKLTLSPQVFIMSSPISYQPSTKSTIINRSLGFLIGSSFDYRISKRFGFSVNYRANFTTEPGSQILHNFLVGSRVIL
jgi:hypothetical protein